MKDSVVHRQKDRVSVAYQRTLNIGNFESVQIHTAYDTDVKKDETVEEAFVRADEVASAKLEELCDPIESMKSKAKGKGR